MSSCKKSDNLIPDVEKNLEGHKSNGNKTSSAGDGLWDLLGYGYDVTGEYANSQSAKYSVIDVEKLDLEHPTFVESSGAETGISFFEAGENAENFSRKLTNKVDIKGGVGALFKGTINANFDYESKWSSKYIYSTYSSVAIKKRVYMINDVNVLKNYLHQDFLNNVQSYTAQQLVSMYGTHVFTDIKLGGKIELIYQSETTSSDRILAAGAGASNSFGKIFSITTTTRYNSTDHQNNFNEKAFVRTVGGNSGGVLATITFNSAGTPSSTFNLTSWQSGITDANAELIDITPGGAIPIYDLIDDPIKAAEVKDYVDQYLLDNQVKINTKPLYRLRKDGSPAIHILTTSTFEANYLVSQGWVMEGQQGDVFNTQTIGTTALYRYYRSATLNHFYSTSSVTPGGYIAEGIIGYVYPGNIPPTNIDTKAVYSYYNANKGLHLYTTN